jgi:acyl-CoA thioesterase
MLRALSPAMDNIRAFFDRDDFAKHCGIELASVGPGHAIARMLVQPHHLNGYRTAQGGAIFTLADFAFAAASNSHGRVAVAINVSITFMKAVSSGNLTAEAREVSANPKLGSYTVHVTDETQALVAVFQGLAYRKSELVTDALQKG